ncbi:MAG TPA: hypothetical protein VK974_09985 [Methylophilaceae bacterium]|nr:hypothetical protein [Methylotenera sp.]HSH73374.1 hypothetical protein [Methylophilaceae bacterium]
MWGTILKLVAMKFVGHRLHLIVVQLMSFIERRAQIFIHNMGEEWNRLLKTLIGFIVVLTALVFSALIGAAWIVAIAWESPSRDVILGIAILIPLVIVLFMAIYLRSLWHKKPYLENSRSQLHSDWQVLRGALNERNPAEEEPAVNAESTQGEQEPSSQTEFKTGNVNKQE